jgi:hypothetical protein
MHLTYVPIQRDFRSKLFRTGRTREYQERCNFILWVLDLNRFAFRIFVSPFLLLLQLGCHHDNFPVSHVFNQMGFNKSSMIVDLRAVVTLKMSLMACLMIQQFFVSCKNLYALVTAEFGGQLVFRFDIFNIFDSFP